MYYRPTKVDYEGLRFLIMSAPVDSIMKQTIKVSMDPCPPHQKLVVLGPEALPMRPACEDLRAHL